MYIYICACVCIYLYMYARIILKPPSSISGQTTQLSHFEYLSVSMISKKNHPDKSALKMFDVARFSGEIACTEPTHRCPPISSATKSNIQKHRRACSSRAAPCARIAIFVFEKKVQLHSSQARLLVQSLRIVDKNYSYFDKIAHLYKIAHICTKLLIFLHAHILIWSHISV